MSFNFTKEGDFPSALRDEVDVFEGEEADELSEYVF
jgi:hypothetical protein